MKLARGRRSSQRQIAVVAEALVGKRRQAIGDIEDRRSARTRRPFGPAAEAAEHRAALRFEASPGVGEAATRPRAIASRC
ncbi:MAG: hypothetical protein ACLPN5_05365 [Roseiarcus sp.]